MLRELLDACCLSGGDRPSQTPLTCPAGLTFRLESQIARWYPHLPPEASDLLSSQSPTYPVHYRSQYHAGVKLQGGLSVQYG